MAEELQIRIHGTDARPTLVYLPGMHGDWTLIPRFRKAVSDRVRFVEFTYPRTLTWSLEDYAGAIENSLAQNGLTHGWLLAESFGSQIAWILLARGRFRVTGLLLAGGFVRHPLQQMARWAERLTGTGTFRLLVRAIFGLGRLVHRSSGRSPETEAMWAEFFRRRTELDRLAARHRLHLVTQSDPRATAANTAVPVFHLAGWLDPIVPWPPVKRWLQKNCPAFRASRIIKPADHAILVTAPEAAAEQILTWMQA